MKASLVYLLPVHGGLNLLEVPEVKIYPVRLMFSICLKFITCGLALSVALFFVAKVKKFVD